MTDLPEFEPTLTRLNFEGLVKGYSELETAIQNLALLNFEDALAKPKQFTGNPIEHDGELYHVGADFSELTRTYNVVFMPINRSRSEKIELELNLREVGAVRTIKVVCLRRSERRVQAALKRMHDVIRSNYQILETSFRGQYRSYHQHLFEGIEPILHASFEKYDLPQLKYECRLSLTQLKNSRYSTYIGPDQLLHFLKEFKKSDEVAISPLASAITLVVGEANDTFISRQILSPDEFKTLTFGELATDSGNDLEMLAAESILTRGETLAVREVCRASGFSIQANIAASLADAADAPISAARTVLAKQFEFNLTGSLAKRRELALAWMRNPKNRNSLVRATSDMVAKITSNVISGLLKPH